MVNAYELPSTPILVDLGASGKASVRASVPFAVGPVRYCAGYLHNVGTGRRQAAVFRALNNGPTGTLKVWTGK